MRSSPVPLTTEVIQSLQVTNIFWFSFLFCLKTSGILLWQNKNSLKTFLGPNAGTSSDLQYSQENLELHFRTEIWEYGHEQICGKAWACPPISPVGTYQHQSSDQAIFSQCIAMREVWMKKRQRSIMHCYEGGIAVPLVYLVLNSDQVSFISVMGCRMISAESIALDFAVCC